jgi:peptidyl-dipeptidase Dcp
MCKTTAVSESNPLLRSWAKQPFHLPPFEEIEPSHFKPALEAAMEAHIGDLEAIASSSSNDFDSILGAYDRAGSLYSKVGGVYGNYISSLNTPDMQEVQSAMAPILSRHRSKCYNIPGLYDKVKSMYDIREEMARKGKWTAEQVRLAERVYIAFVRMGAKLNEEEKKEYADIQAELATLQTKFMQNMLKDEETWEMVISKDDMAGCPDDLVAAAKQAAIDRGHEEDDAHVITLGRSLVEPFLTYSTRRDLRKKAFDAWTSRGELSEERDNLSIATKILRLRKRQANLMGHSTFANFQCEDTMAQTPENVMKLSMDVWERAKAAANKERAMMESFLTEKGEKLEGGILPHDWRFYAEQVRQANYNFDESELKPYLSLESVTNAVFDVSNKLYGLKYVKRDDIKAYHKDVNVYEVRRAKKDSSEDELVAIFLHDNYARANKSSGAWMSEYRTQKKNLVAGTDPIESVPIVSNNNNFAKGSGATLLSFDDGTTLFHEMGHAHHGMLSDATFEYLASTSVLKDFVELPSQLMEHWLEEPIVLKKHAKHYKTGETVPDDLLARLKAASLFNEGFATVEYTACALLDMAVHSLSEYDDDFDLSEFEKKYLAEIGMPQGIVMRHRPAHFAHLFASSSYAAGYYVYQWAQVLDNDVFEAFKETGDVFDSETAERCRKFIYSAGNTVAPQDLFKAFRGREPDTSFFLKNKGMA